MNTPKLIHACEYETSLMLALRIDWIAMVLAKGSRAQRESRYYDPLSYSPSRVAVSEAFAQMTENGTMGRPELAMREKGWELFDLITPCLVDFVSEFSKWPFTRKKNTK